MNEGISAPTLKSFSLFQAPNTPIRPYLIKEDEEVVELILSGRVFYEDGTYSRNEYGRRALFWHYPGEHTIYESHLQNPYYCMAFQFQTQGQSLRDRPKISYWKREEELDIFLREMVETYFAGSNKSLHYGQYIYKRLIWQTVSLPLNPQQDNLSPKLKKLLAHIEMHLDFNWDVNNMAKYLKISSSCLHNWFLESMNVTPHQVLLEKRLIHARFLLAGSSKCIKEISGLCGFNNLETFYRSFKKTTECTPLEYRQRNQITYIS